MANGQGFGRGPDGIIDVVLMYITILAALGLTIWTIGTIFGPK